MNDGEAIRHSDWASLPSRTGYRIPSVATVRVCDRIEPEQLRTDGVSFVDLTDRYGALTGELELRGSATMARRRDGEVGLVGALRAAAPWMAPAIDLVAEQIDVSLWAGNPWLRLRPLLLVGGPGTGKSYFAKLLAEASGCALMQLPMGGDTDNRSLAGTARGWLGAQPALPLVGMAQSGSANPVVVLDEIDKVSPEKRNGNAHDTLLAMLEPVTSSAWYDRCLMAAVDLRHVVWVATANGTHALSPRLLSRFDVVRVRAPDPGDVPGILDRFRIEFASRHGLPAGMLPPLTSTGEALLVQHFARTRSLRQLRRGLDMALRQAIGSSARSVQ